MRLLLSVAFCSMAIVGAGCSSYIPPSGRADLSQITSYSMKESFSAKPAAGFPAGIAAVRIQAPGYHSYSTEREGGVWGTGRYSVFLNKEVEDNADLERLAKLPDIGGLITISRLLLPEHLDTDKDLREAAARLKADMLLMYTFDTTFHDNNASVALTTVTLGLSPTKVIYVNTTCSAILIDTRTGFIYAAMEASERRKTLSNAWESKEVADRQRLDAEKAAFKSLVGEFEKNWPAVVERAKKGA